MILTNPASLVMGPLLILAFAFPACRPLAKVSESRSPAPQSQALDADKKSLWTRPGQDWPSFLGLHRDGKSAETDLLDEWPDGKLPVVWTADVGEGYGSGSVANGRYYHFDRMDDQARLRCLNAESGQPLWQFTYPTSYGDMYGFDGGPRASPVVDDERVYILGVEGQLHCLDARSGQVKWKVDTTKAFGVIQNFFGVGSTPLVHNNLLITMIGGSPASAQDLPPNQLDRVEPNGSAIVAFDKFDGSVQYKTGDDLASYSSPVVAEINGQTVGLAFCRANLIAFDPDHGDLRWTFGWRAIKYESVNASTPVIWDNKILITESYGPGGALLEVNNGSVKPIWSDKNKRDQVAACHWCTPIVKGGFAYLSSGEKLNRAELRCVELSTGKIQWTQGGLSRVSLTLAGDLIVGLAENGRLFSLRPTAEKFEIISEYRPGDLRLVGPCWAAPILSHGLLYVRDKSKVVCFDLKK